MNRLDLQQLADDRITDAQALLDAGRWSVAYYLAGYAVECALKACVAKQTNLHDFPEKDKVQRSFTHNLFELVKVAVLHEDLLGTQRESNSDLYRNWQIVKDWSERARYEQTTEQTARELSLAITDSDDGVLPWVKRDW